MSSPSFHTPSNRKPHIAVVGAGIGGLVTAAELASHGARVTLLERASTVGGKMRQGHVSGKSLDVGPTVLTMRWVFEQIAKDMGVQLAEMVTLTQAEVLARHGWTDGSQLDLFADPEKSAAAIAEFAGQRDAEGFRRFCDYSRGIYESSEDPFIKNERPTFASLFGTFGMFGLGRLRRIDSMRSMWRAVCEYFSDPRLRQLFARYATYYGCSPFRAPATLNIIAHIELEGVWLVDGGMYRLAQAFEEQLQRLGVELRLDTEVGEVVTSGDRVAGLRIADGSTLDADAVVLNADIGAARKGLFGPAASRAVGGPVKRERSLSALTLTMDATSAGFPLTYHNVFFSDDYHGEFEDLFEHRRLPRQPTVYICAQDRSGGGSVAGNERLFWIINAPADGDIDKIPQAEIDHCTESANALIGKCGLELREVTQEVTTPADFETAFPATGGALYGLATHSWKDPMLRSGSRTKLPGLYLAGGSVHPGAGVPMSALSGRLAAQALLQDMELSGPGPCP